MNIIDKHEKLCSSVFPNFSTSFWKMGRGEMLITRTKKSKDEKRKSGQAGTPLGLSLDNIFFFALENRQTEGGTNG